MSQLINMTNFRHIKTQREDNKIIKNIYIYE